MRLALFLLAVAGCAAPAQQGEWVLSGSFTAERTEDDIAAVCEAGAGSRSCPIMESFPEQFSFRFRAEAACEQARERILDVPHTNVGACRKVGPITVSPDAPTSASPE